jgi:acyl-CoA thioesterase I
MAGAASFGRLGRLAIIAAFVVPFPATAEVETREACRVADAGLLRLAEPLQRAGRRIAQHRPLVIVALGSSSTTGIGTSSAAAAYPAQLEASLRRRLPGVAVSVLNRGVNGEDAVEMNQRLERDVLAARPDLTIWQLGSNAAIRGTPPAEIGAALRNGISRLQASGSDVVLMNPQYAPALVQRPELAPVLAEVEMDARAEQVGLFSRYRIMEDWVAGGTMTLAGLIGGDGLHMSDLGHACVAEALAEAIVDALVPPPPPAASAALPE